METVLRENRLLLEALTRVQARGTDLIDLVRAERREAKAFLGELRFAQCGNAGTCTNGAVVISVVADETVSLCRVHNNGRTIFHIPIHMQEPGGFHAH